jgi:hypothetical protein
LRTGLDIIKGQTWLEFWQRIFSRYPSKEMYDEYHRMSGYQEPFEGSEQGYALSFHLDTLEDAGFRETAVYWSSGLRAVYGGRK